MRNRVELGLRGHLIATLQSAGIPLSLSMGSTRICPLSTFLHVASPLLKKKKISEKQTNKKGPDKKGLPALFNNRIN